MSAALPPGELPSACQAEITAPASDDEAISRSYERLTEALRAAYPPDKALEADALTCYLRGCFDVWGMTIAALVGRGLVEPHNLRLDLLMVAKNWRRDGLEVRALPLEHQAANLTKLIKAAEQIRRSPPQSGRA
jgi:hypothetical protein